MRKRMELIRINHMRYRMDNAENITVGELAEGELTISLHSLSLRGI